MTEVPKVSPLAPAPSRGQARDDYSATADAFAASLPPMVDQINEVAEFVHEKAVAAAEAGSFAQVAQGHADDAQQSATAAEASSQSAITAAAAAQASAGLPSLEGNDGKTLVVSGEGVKWGDVSSLKRRPISAGYSLSADDKGLLISASGTLTQTFQPAATLGEGWFCYLQNAGNGDITLDPDGAETIDGLSSYIMYPGEVRLVQCDGHDLRTIVLNSFYKVFTVSGNFIKPPGYTAFSGLMWSGGPGGTAGVLGNVNKTINGISGANAARFMIESSSLAQNSVTVIIGAGGAGGVISNPAYSQGGFNTVGQNGGSTSFGSYTITYNSISTDMPTALPSAIACGSSGGVSVFYSGTWQKSEGGAGSSLLGGGGGAGVCYQYSGSPVPSVTLVGNNGLAPGGAGGHILAQSWNGGWFTNPTSIAAGDGARGELRIWGVI